MATENENKNKEPIDMPNDTKERGLPNFLASLCNHQKRKPTNGEKVVMLAKERDLLCDGIKETEMQLHNAVNDPEETSRIKTQLNAMHQYRGMLNERIKALLEADA